MCMKRISVVAGLAFMLISILTNAQEPSPSLKQSYIQPVPLKVTFGKTTNLIFPYAIKSVDKGSRDLLAQIAKGVENILQIKAGKQGIDETNLTVVTGDGKLYSYMVVYSDESVPLNIKMDGSIHTIMPDALFTYRNDNEARVHDFAEQLSLKQPTIKGIGNRGFNIELQLEGIYIKDGMLYFQIGLENNSNINYDIDQLRFYFRDRKISKRTASQEIELKPLQFAGNTTIIRGQSKQSIVAVLPKFTIPDQKILAIQLMEGNGGRHLQLKIKNKTIVRAKALN